MVVCNFGSFQRCSSVQLRSRRWEASIRNCSTLPKRLQRFWGHCWKSIADRKHFWTFLRGDLIEGIYLRILHEFLKQLFHFRERSNFVWFLTQPWEGHCGNGQSGAKVFKNIIYKSVDRVCAGKCTYFTNESVLAVAINIRERVAADHHVEFNAIVTSFTTRFAFGEFEIGDVRFPFGCAPLEEPFLALVTGTGPPRTEKPPTVMWGLFVWKLKHV